MGDDNQFDLSDDIDAKLLAAALVDKASKSDETARKRAERQLVKWRNERCADFLYNLSLVFADDDAKWALREDAGKQLLLSCMFPAWVKSVKQDDWIRIGECIDPVSDDANEAAVKMADDIMEIVEKNS